MTHIKTKYLCDFCEREYAIKTNAERHQQVCLHDPDNRACITCSHFQPGFEFECEIDAMPYCDGEAMQTDHCNQWMPIEVQP
jgi:hypothetical protein